MQTVYGKDITFSRPSVGSVSISKAVPGTSQHEISQDGMVIEQVRSRDWLVLVSALVLNGSPVLPRKGDKITVDGKELAVLCMGSDAQWKYTDQSEQIIRIHTREM